VKKLLAVLLLLIVVVTAALVFFIWRRPAPRSETLLPENTLVLIRTPDFTKAREDFHKTAAFALWQEPEVQAFLAEPLRALNEMIGSPAITEDGKVRGLVMDALQGEVFLAVTHVVPMPQFEAGVVFGADTRKNFIQTKVLIATITRNLKRHSSKQQVMDKRFLGVDYTLWRKDLQHEVCFGFLNNLLVITWGEGTMRDVITRFTHHAPPDSLSLAGSSTFQQFLSQLPGDHQFMGYLNPQPITSILAPLLAFQPQGAQALSKLAAIQVVGLSVTCEGPTIHEVRVTQFKPNSQKPSPPIARKTLTFTSTNSLAYSTYAADIAGMYEEASSALAQSGLPGPGAEIMNFESALRANNIHLREDVLQHLVGRQLAGRHRNTRRRLRYGVERLGRPPRARQNVRCVEGNGVDRR
jgi:hypothetical protein